MKNFDSIEKGYKTVDGRPSIRYTKRYNGTTYVVEEVRTKRKEMAFKTMWKRPSAPDAPALQQSSAQSSETFGGILPTSSNENGNLLGDNAKAKSDQTSSSLSFQNVEQKNNDVNFVMSLTQRIEQGTQVADESDIRALREQYKDSDFERWFENELGYSFDYLTASEARYLRNAKDADTARARITQARQEGNSRLYPDEIPRSEREASSEVRKKQTPKPNSITNQQELLNSGFFDQSAPSSIERFEDFGEVLPDARKHQAWFNQAISSSDIDLRSAPLSKSFPRPDYNKLIDSGMPPEKALLLAKVRAEVPNKKPSRLTQWVSKVEEARNKANTIMQSEASAQALAADMYKFNKKINDYLAIANDVMPQQIESLAKFDISESFFQLFRGEKNVSKVTVTDASKKSGAFGRGRETYFDTTEEAIAFIKSQVTAQDSQGKPATKFDIWSVRGERGYFIGKKVAARKFIEPAKAETLSEAKKLIRENNAQYVELLAEKRKVGAHRRIENNPRIGKDYRQGANVTSKLFANTFGFRGVQFGNYVENDRRQEDINNAYDGLMDLAYILDIPPKALSLNGELGLAFGARGRGGQKAAMAHYEPDNIVINLTKKNGAASLAHEWFHALDHYFGRNDKIIGDNPRFEEFMTDLSRKRGIVKDGVYRRTTLDDFSTRQAVFNAFQSVIEAIDSTEMPNRSKRLDNKKVKSYWSTRIEMGARSFERFIIDKLQQKGYESDYLANIIDKETWDENQPDAVNNEDSYPYPTDSEALVINDAFTRLFDIIETKEQDDGNVILFNKTVSTNDQSTVEKANRRAQYEERLGQFFKEYAGAKGQTNIVIAPTPTQVFGSEATAGKGAERAPGAYDPATDTLFLFTDNIQNEEQLLKTLRHELITHKGLGMFGVERQAELLRQINQTKTSNNKQIKALWQEIDTQYGNESDAIQAEEFLAKLSESDMPAQSWLSKQISQLVKLFRQALRSMGLMVDDNISLQDMKNVVLDISDALRAGIEPAKRNINQVEALFDSAVSGITLSAVNDNAINNQNVTIGRADASEIISGVVGTGFSNLDTQNGFTLVSTFYELPAEIKQAANESGNNQNVYGVIHNDQIFLVLDKHRNAKELETTILHEYYGHKGLRNLFGKNLLTSLNQLFVANGGMRGLLETAKRNDIDLAPYISAGEQMSKQNRQAMLMDELLAHLAQDNRPSVKCLALEVLGYIRDVMRKVGLFNLSRLNDFDLMYTLKQARQTFDGDTSGNDAGKNSPRFMVVAKQRQFDRSAMGKIEKAIDAIVVDRRFKKEKVSLGETPKVMQMLGAKKLPLKFDLTKLYDTVSPDRKHNLTAEQAIQAIEHIADPVAVFESKTSDGSLVALTEVMKDDKPIIAAVHLDKEGNINKLASVYERTNNVKKMAR